MVNIIFELIIFLFGKNFNYGRDLFQLENQKHKSKKKTKTKTKN